MARHRDSAKERSWRLHFARWRSSGLSVRAYCQAQGLSEPSFYAWRRLLSERPSDATAARGLEATTPAFIPVRLIDEPNPGAAATTLEVVLRGGRVVRVTPGFRADTLRELVAALEERSC
jgi:transposase